MSVDRPRLSFRSIVHVNEKGGRFGGTEEYLDLCTSHLLGRGVRSHLVCGVAAGELPAELESVQVVPGLASRRSLAGTAAEVATAVDSVDPDVVHIHNIFDARIIAALDRPGRRTTLVWYIHDHYLTCLTELRVRNGEPCAAGLGAGCIESVGRGECTRRLADQPLDGEALGEREALLRACRRVDAVIVVSPYMRELVAAHLPDMAARVHLLPRPVRNGVSLGGRSQAPTPMVVAFAGRITPEKGLHVVLEALERLPPGIAVQFNIAGVVERPDYWARCVELAATASASHPAVTVNYLGHLPYGAVDDLFASAHVVVVPSCWPEPLGMVAIEALQAGAEVVAARVGGLGTYLQRAGCGTLIEPGDVGGWAAALGDLAARRRTAPQVGTSGAEAVRHLTAENHFAAFDEVIRGVRC
jgi:glycosyltransferase involved in cell wall biosynthesis